MSALAALPTPTGATLREIGWELARPLDLDPELLSVARRAWLHSARYHGEGARTRVTATPGALITPRDLRILVEQLTGAPCLVCGTGTTLDGPECDGACHRCYSWGINTRNLVLAEREEDAAAERMED